jgi:hypothetical protein
LFVSERLFSFEKKGGLLKGLYLVRAEQDCRTKEALRMINTSPCSGKTPVPDSFTATGVFAWKISDLTKLRGKKAGEYHETESFEWSGHEWALRVYPSGVSQQYNGRLSAQLVHKSKSEVIISRCVLSASGIQGHRDASVDLTGNKTLGPGGGELYR